MTSTTTTTTSESENGIVRLTGPRYPCYNTIESRLSTFKYWPRALAQTPKIMAEAGLFYTGHGDHVTCFYCACTMIDWDPTDDVITDHARWSPECGFVLLTKGSEFVKNAIDTAPDTMFSRMCEHRRLDGLPPLTRDVKVVEKKEEKEKKEDEEEEEEEVEEMKQCEVSSVNEVVSVVEYDRVKERVRKLEEARLCKVCLEKEISSLILPCAHMVSCTHCTSSLVNCPFCRRKISGAIRSFLV